MYSHILYFELNALCILILAFLTYRLSVTMYKQKANIDFRNAMLAVMAIMALEIVWSLIDGKPGVQWLVINYIVDILDFIMCSVVSLLWLKFVVSKLAFKIELEIRGKALLSLPIVIVIVLSLVSIKTGWVFTISAANVYERGPINGAVFTCALIYMILAFALVIFRLANARGSEDKRKSVFMTTFFFLPVVGVILSSIYPSLPATWPLATVSLLMIFVTSMEAEVSTDGLTGLNNRRQFDKRLNDMVKVNSSDGNLYLFLMDINHFKDINDGFGHYEGDRALVRTAKILKKSIAKSNLFLARYGGDEFAILGFIDGMIEAEALKARIQRRFADNNVAIAKEYDINLGIGYYEFGDGHAETIQELISGADKNLYDDKARQDSVIFRPGMSK